MQQAVHTEVRPDGERIKIETAGHGWRRCDTIIRTSGTGRNLRVKVEFKHYGPFGWLHDILFRWISKNAD